MGKIKLLLFENNVAGTEDYGQCKIELHYERQNETAVNWEGCIAISYAYNMSFTFILRLQDFLNWSFVYSIIVLELP